MSAVTSPVMTTAQAASYLQVDQSTIYRLIRDGRLNAARIGRGYRITVQRLDRLLVENRVRSDVPIREFDEKQITEFFERDTLTPEAKATVRNIEQQLPTAYTAYMER